VALLSIISLSLSVAAPGLQEAAAESSDKLVSPKYNGEAEPVKQHHRQITSKNALYEDLAVKTSFRRGDRVVYGAALDICR
jgi:hypothetical protein